MGEDRLDGEESVAVFQNVLNEHAQTFHEETGMDISYNEEHMRFELDGLEFKYSFTDQIEADAHAEKVHRFDAECGEVIADFRQQIHQMYEPDPETHLRDRNGFYCARGINDSNAFKDHVYGGRDVNQFKHDAMHSVADRFQEQHPDYRMGVYFTPCASVSLFPVDWDGLHDTMNDVAKPTKKYLASLTPEQMDAHKQLLKDFDLASDDFIYAAASGIDRGAEDDFTKAVESLNGQDNGLEM